VVDIFDEVDEDLRAERVGRFARRYAIAFLGLAVAIVVCVGLWQAWLWHVRQRDAAAATAFLSVMDAAGKSGSSGDRQALAARFSTVAETSPEGYATLARLNQASLLADAGKLDQANAIWNRLMSDDSVNPVLRQVAILGWASHALDTAEPSLIQARLQPLASDDSAWRPMALQDLALLDLRQGNRAAAAKRFQTLADDVTTPDDMRRLAGALAQALAGAKG
jgi:hypothetical protein